MAKSGEPWTQAETDRLQHAWATEHKSYAAIGREMRRSKSGIHAKIIRMREEEGEQRWPHPIWLESKKSTKVPPVRSEPVLKARPLPPGARTIPLLPSEFHEAGRSWPDVKAAVETKTKPAKRPRSADVLR